MKISRRVVVAGAASALAVPSTAVSSKQKIRLGGPVFLKSDDPVELAKEHRRLGYSAAYCPKAEVTDRDRVRLIEKAFAAENVVVAEVGAWVNMLEPDADKRRKNLMYVSQRCALADAVGARCCVDIAGSYHPEHFHGFHPKNITREYFDATVENCRRIIDDVKPSRTKFTIEMQVGLQPEGPDEYLRLIKAVDRKAFAVHLDVCNGINQPNRFYRNAEFIRECFRKLGKWVMSCHAKDLAWVNDGYNMHFAEVGPGKGVVDYRAYLDELSKMAWETPLMLEHLKTPQEYHEAKQHILKVGKQIGVAFA